MSNVAMGKRNEPSLSLILTSVYRGIVALLCWVFVELYRDIRGDISAVKALVEQERATLSALKAVQETHTERIRSLENQKEKR